MGELKNDDFYERFWADARYQLAYAFDSAVRDRYPAIRKVWGDMRQPERVLDYGCGNGVLSFWLWSNGFGKEIRGVDVSQTGLTFAKKAFACEGLSYAEIETLDGLHGKNFDVVVASHVLEHIEQPELVVTRLAELAEWLVLEVPLEDCLCPALLSRLKNKSRRENPVGHVNFWNKKSFHQFLKHCGLLVVRDYQYVSAPYSPFNHWIKRGLELLLLRMIGLRLYSRLLATHYIVLARKIDSACEGESI